MAKFFNPSPSAGFIHSLFGTPSVTLKGGVVAKKRSPKYGFPAGIFGPSTVSQIGDYLNYQDVFSRGATAAAQTGDFSLLPAEIYDPYRQATTGIDQLLGAAQPVVSALIESGLPVDIAPLVAGAQSRFSNLLVPEIAERFSPEQGTGFQNIAAREANLLATELGQLEFNAQEAARQRQLEGITVGAPALSSLYTARTSLPIGLLEDLYGLGQAGAAATPGARALAALLALTQPTFQSAQDPRVGLPSSGGGGSEGGLGGILGSLGSITGILGGLGEVGGGVAGGALLCWVADELFGADDPRAYFARLWCAANYELPFVQHYQTEGPFWAAAVRQYPAIRAAVLPAWEWMAEQGAQLAEGI